MKRFKTINFVEKLELEDVELPKTPDSPYVVDDSCFIPMSEAIKQLSVNNSSGTSDGLMYDFPNGKDDGRAIPISRCKDCRDIAEVSAAIMEDVNKVTESLESERKVAKKRADFEASLQSIKNAGSESNDTTTK